MSSLKVNKRRYMRNQIVRAIKAQAGLSRPARLHFAQNCRYYDKWRKDIKTKLVPRYCRGIIYP